MSKKKIEVKRKKEQSKRRLYIFIFALVFTAVMGFFIYAWYMQLPSNSEKLWSVDDAGKLSFTDRGRVEGYASVLENGNNYTLEKVVYKSFGDDVYALLRKPKDVTKPPVVIVLPAATITKEADTSMAEALCNMGYASLTLDKRGLGETQGTSEGDFDSGIKDYINGGDPVQYKQVYDALKGLDYVKSRADLDGSDVAILGESRGGMWAIVAAGEEPQFKGVITVSSSDFTMPDTNNASVIKYINALMPSKYLGNIPPRKLAMFQFDGDKYVPMADGKALFDNASEPKAWHVYNGTTHGQYDSVYASDLHEELKGMLGR